MSERPNCLAFQFNKHAVPEPTPRSNLFIGNDPVAGTTLVTGRYTYAFDAEGNLIQSQTGTGQRIDVCELLS